MKTIDKWKALLRTRLREALGAKDKPALSLQADRLANLGVGGSRDGP